MVGRHYGKAEQGYALPLVVGLSFMMLVLTLQVLGPLTSTQSQIQTAMYSRMSQRAAEAGALYAQWCLEQNDGVPQWTDAKPLKPNTDCTGTIRAGATCPTAACFLASAAGLNIAFSVPAPTSTGDSLRINPSGVVNLSTAGGSTYRTVAQTLIAQTSRDALPWKQVSLGDVHTCAVASDDKAYCWGSNFVGVLGNGTGTNSLVPVAVSTSGVLSGKTIKAISSGFVSPCAIASDDKAYCWGRNTNGQLGNGTTTNSSVPVSVSTSGVLSGKTIKAISPGTSSTCAIASDDKAYCWGYNGSGELGNGTTASSLVPVAVSTSGVLSGKTIKAIGAMSYGHTCVIASDDRAYCWGGNANGQLGNGTTTSSSVPVAVSTSGVLSGKTIKAIGASSYRHNCVIASDDKAYCWGWNGYGQLGNGTTTSSSVPVAVSTSGVLSGKAIKAIDVGSHHTCVIASDDRAYCWGSNGSGQLGNGTTTSSSVPVAGSSAGVLNGKTLKAASSGNSITCAIASDSKAYCWGGNNIGQFGNGTTTSSSVPVAGGAVYGKKLTVY